MVEPFHKVITGDTATELHAIDDASVDGIVCDPPFGIGFKYNQHDDTAEGYGLWLWSILEIAERKCKPGSPVFVWQAMPNVRRFAEWFPRDWRLFAAAKNFVQMRPCAMQFSYDPVVVWWTPGEVWAHGTASRDFHIADTSPSTRRHGAMDFVEGHPCPRPLGQVRHVVEQWVRPGGCVLDPFAGSGTTLVAAKMTGRSAIGIEIDESYSNIARRRIADAASLFHQPQTEAEPCLIR